MSRYAWAAAAVVVAASGAHAEAFNLTCESTETWHVQACTPALDNGPCVRWLKTAVLKLDLDARSIELTDPRVSTTWSAGGATVTDAIVAWNHAGSGSPQRGFQGSLNRLTGDVDLTFGNIANQFELWAFTGRCRRATQKF